MFVCVKDRESGVDVHLRWWRGEGGGKYMSFKMGESRKDRHYFFLSKRVKKENQENNIRKETEKLDGKK